MKQFTLFFLFIVFTFQSLAQGNKKDKEDLQRMNMAYQKLTWCYHGVRDNQSLEIMEMARLMSEGTKEIASLRGKYGPNYPIFFSLCDHMRLSMEKDALNACRHLRNALDEFRKLNNEPVIKADALRLSYKNNFSIDSMAVRAFYKSQYCKDLNILLDTPCPQRNVPPKPPEERKPEPEVRDTIAQKQLSMIVQPAERSKPQIQVNTPDGVFLEVGETRTIFKLPDADFSCPNPLDMLRQVLSRGLITGSLEITEMVPGDGRLIPGQQGVPYEVKLKNARTKEVIFFEGGQYVIEDQSAEKVDRFFSQYQQAYTDFTRLVLWIMDDYGNSAYQIFVQGSADSVLFTPKTLHPTYADHNMFKEFSILSIDRKTSTVKDAVFHLADRYDNSHLPELRAAFIRTMLLSNDRLQGRPEKITIVKGNVKPYSDKSKRNCSIIIYIDWKRAKQPH